MVTHVDQISTPPTPADPPAVFEERAAQVWSDLARAIPQLNQQADEIEVIGQAADAAKLAAQADSDAALGYRNEANAANSSAQSAAVSAGAGKDAAEVAKRAAEVAAESADESAVAASEYAEAAASALGAAGAAIAMADTYTSVPATYKAWLIAVTQPHLRIMVWNGTKYVRAPFHRSGDIHFALPNVTTWPGALPLRGDLVWNKADYPDLAEVLGVAGSTFTLAEARGRVLRALDNGVGLDPGRAWASLQNDAMREIEGSTGTLYGNSDSRLGQSGSSTGALKANTSVSTQIPQNVLVGAGFQGVSSFSFKASDAGVPIASEIRMKNIAFNIFVDY